jgi:hypothetical protein
LPWWAGPITVVAVLTAFGIYSMLVTVILRQPGEFGNYISPFYSPEVGLPGWLPSWVVPSMFVLWIPLGFRATCYYYRKAYYRSFFFDPPACSSEAQKYDRPYSRNRQSYGGERGLFVWNNIHRYFLYASTVVVFFLWFDTFLAFFPEGFASGFSIRVGSLLFLTNVILLSLYTFSCHSMRHLVGGNVDCYSCTAGGKARRKVYGWVSKLNGRHSLWAWLSLFSVLGTDIYIRLLMFGVINDPTIIG